MTVRIDVTPTGYEQIRTADGSTLQHHRVLLFAWGRLDSVFFENDAREVHHSEPIKWLNFEASLSALSPAEHREVDPGRARISTPWDDVGDRAGEA